MIWICKLYIYTQISHLKIGLVFLIGRSDKCMPPTVYKPTSLRYEKKKKSSPPPTQKEAKLLCIMIPCSSLYMLSADLALSALFQTPIPMFPYQSGPICARHGIGFSFHSLNCFAFYDIYCR